MSALYGSLQGNRGATTRGGSDVIHTWVQTWGGRITIRLWRDGDFLIELGPAQRSGREVARGNVNERTIRLTAKE